MASLPGVLPLPTLVFCTKPQRQSEGPPHGRALGLGALLGVSLVRRGVATFAIRRGSFAKRFPEWLQPQEVPRCTERVDFLRYLKQGEAAVIPSAVLGDTYDPVDLFADPITAPPAPERLDLEKWNFEYLESQMEGSEWRVHLVPKKGQRFQRVYGEGVGEGLVTTMSFPEFAQKSLAEGPYAYYMQVPFSGRPLESLGEIEPYGGSVMSDRRQILERLQLVAEEAQLGELDNNQLWIGRGGSLTPCHYDKAENLHLQIQGQKSFLLIPPEQTFAVYPYPIDHPLDSFSMVDFDAPDLQRFERFGSLTPLEVTLQPGELLYLPKYWWHQVAQGVGDNISLNFWCAQRQADQMSIFQETSPRCRPLLAHRFLEDFTGGMVSRLKEAGALAENFTTARFLKELDEGWAEDTPEGLRRLGSMVRGRLAEVMGGLTEEELSNLLQGTLAAERLSVPRPDASRVTTASVGEMGGWLENSKSGALVGRSNKSWTKPWRPKNFRAKNIHGFGYVG